MNCPKCKVYVGEVNQVCYSCGYDFSSDKVEEKPKVEFVARNEDNLFTPNDQARDYVNQNPNKVSNAITFGIFGLVLVLANLFLPFTHIIGLILGILAVSNGKKDKVLGLRNSTLGLVLGVVTIILGVLFTILGVIGSLGELAILLK